MLGALWGGAYILAFFGVSLAALRIAGGVFVATRAWSLLQAPETTEERKQEHEPAASVVSPPHEIIPTGDVWDGEEAVREYFAESRAAFPDQRNEIIQLHHMDDGVAAEFILRGTHEGDLRGMPPTGKKFECRMIALFLFEPDSDRIVCERVYFDRATILAQLAS